MKIRVTLEFDDDVRKMIARGNDALALPRPEFDPDRRASRIECQQFIRSAMHERVALAEVDAINEYGRGAYIPGTGVHVR